jgi:hypothetical protein
MICGACHAPPRGGFRPRSLRAFAIARVVKPASERRHRLAQRLRVGVGLDAGALADRRVAELRPVSLRRRERLARAPRDEAARYQRDPMVERRRPVMQAWADYVTDESAGTTVIPFADKQR